MKILYLTTTNMSEKSGVTFKIQGQVYAMRKKGIEVDIIYPKSNLIELESFQSTKILGQFKKIPVLSFFTMIKKLYFCSQLLIEKKTYTAIYIRYSFFDKNFFDFIRILKNFGTKIFLEIPSYPYDAEYRNKNILKKLSLFIDKYYRTKVSNYIDYCFTPSKINHDIYGIKTVSFDNGVNVESIPKRKYKQISKNGLRILAVANVFPWHGYDRIIRGIAEYEGSKKISFHIVGDGFDIKNLRDLAKELGLTQEIVFHGKKFGKELDQIFNSSEIGIGAIAMHRLNLENVSSLKTKEYCLRSLPFVALEGDLDFKSSFDYVLHVESNDNSVDMDEIIDFFERTSKKDYISDMREYAEKFLSWDTKFKPVIDKMKSCY